MFQVSNGDSWRGIGYNNRDLPVTSIETRVQTTKTAKRSEPPFFLASGRYREVSRVIRLLLMQPGDGSRFHGPLQARHQPTAPSICSSISRFSSSAYSIGSSRAIGSTKPRTIVAIASSSVMPRLIR